MARFEDIKSIINTYIKPNGKEEITGEVLQNVLRAMMEAVDIVVDEVVAAFPQISGSEFVDVLENKVSLLLDPQGHLGNTGRGLGVVMDKVMSDDSLNPVSNKVVKAYIDKIRSDLNLLVSGDLSSAIDNFNEIIEFLSSIEDSETLSGIIAGLETALKKYADGVAQAAYDQSYSDSVGASSAYTDGKIAALAAVARTGSYNDLKDKPTIPDVSGKQDKLVSGQNIKTINNQSILGSGNIDIQGGGGATPRVEMTAASAAIEPNKFYVWPMMDELNLTLGAEQTGVMNRYLFQFRNPKAGLTMLTLPDGITWSEDTELDENGLPVMEATAFYRIEIIEGLASLKKWKLVYIQFADAEVERVLMDNGVGDGIGITKRDAKKVTSIGTWFQGNENIKSFDELAFFIGVTELSEEAFDGCTALKSIGLDHVRMATRTFGNGSFSGCTSLEKVVMPAIEELKWTFMDCTSLETADLGENCTSIAWRTFQNCPMTTLICRAVTPPTMEDSSLVKTCYIYVPDESVEAYKAAPGWSSRAAYIKGISEYDPSYGSRVIVFADPAVAAIISSNFGNKDDEFTQREADAVTSLGTLFRGNTEMTSFDELNDFHNVTVLKDGVFAGCTALESIGLDNITDISRTSNTGVFDGCTALKRAVMPKVVNLAWSFMGCTSLSFAEIGENCTTIAWRTFQNCPMTTLICRAVTPPTMEDSSLVKTCYIYVPDESVEAYKAAAGWSSRAAYIKGISEYTG